MNERRVLGAVEIDSGTLIVGDPGYLLPRQATGASGIDYETVVRADAQVVATPLGGELVLLLTRFGGDGTYPVVGEFEDGELVRVSIEFLDIEGDLS